jgi:hypothetical protein
MMAREKSRLYELVKKIDMVEFVTRETGRKPVDAGRSWKMVCPMPSHKDTDPSLHIYKASGNWFYRCYGCGSKGTIVDFCVEYKSFDHPYDALVYIVERNGIRNDADFMVKAVKDAKVECDRRARLESSHFLAASNCRALLRLYNGEETVVSWVGSAYRKMNSMLDSGDRMGIEGVSEEACRIISEGVSILHE